MKIFVFAVCYAGISGDKTMKNIDEKLLEIRKILSTDEYAGISIYEVMKVLEQNNLLGGYRKDLHNAIGKGIFYKWKLASEGKLAPGYEGREEVFQVRIIEYYVNECLMDEKRAMELCRYIAVIAASVPLQTLKNAASEHTYQVPEISAKSVRLKKERTRKLFNIRRAGRRRDGNLCRADRTNKKRTRKL